MQPVHASTRTFVEPGTMPSMAISRPRLNITHGKQVSWLIPADYTASIFVTHKGLPGRGVEALDCVSPLPFVHVHVFPESDFVIWS